MRSLIICLSFCLFSQRAFAQDWVVESGTLQYSLKHMLHTVHGKTAEVKGIGKCDKGCTFLVAAPVRSFNSDNSNRDTNMQTITQAAADPIVEVRIAVTPAKGRKESEAKVKFAGRSHAYPVFLDFIEDAQGLRVRTVVPMKLSDFKIERPSLLGVAAEDDVPVEVDLHLRKSVK